MNYGSDHEGGVDGWGCKGRRVPCELEGGKFNARESDDGWS